MSDNQASILIRPVYKKHAQADHLNAFHPPTFVNIMSLPQEKPGKAALCQEQTFCYSEMLSL